MWLLRYAKGVGYKAEILIPDSWILKEGEVLANEGCQVNLLVEIFGGWKKLPTGKENKM